MRTRVGARLLFPELTGREKEIATVSQLVGEVSSGASAVLLIAGEAGLGKTALVRRAAEIARHASLRVLRGDAVRFEIRRPFGPFVEMFRSAGVTAPDTGERTADAGLASSTSVDRYRAHAAYVRAFGELAAERPLAVLVEDLHWADDASLELFAYLARRLASGTLLLGTYRPEDIGERPTLRRALGDVPRDRVHEIDLSPLTATDVGLALRSVLPGAQIRRDTRELLQARTGGNPLVLEEVLRALAERGDISRAGNAWQLADLRDVPVPRSVRDALHERFLAVTSETRRVVSMAAVIGDRFKFELLQQASGDPSQALTSALREAIQAQLIVEVEGSSGMFAFRHALTCEAVLHELLEPERAQLHSVIAHAMQLGQAEESLDALAYHFDKAGDRVNAFTYHDRAAVRAESQFAFADALAHCERALELAASDDLTLGDLELKVAELASMLGHGQRALRAAEAAIQHFEQAGDARRLGIALLEYSRAGFTVGLPREQRAVVARVLDLLEPLGDTRELVEVLASRAFDLAVAAVGNPSRGGGVESAETVARRALAVAERIGSEPARALAHDRIGLALLTAADFGGAVRHLREAVAIAEAHGPADRHLSSLNNLSVALAQASGGHTDESRALQLQRQELRERYGVSDAHGMKLHGLLAEPDWDEFLRYYADHESDTLDWLHLGLHRTLVLTARDGPGDSRDVSAARERLLSSGAGDYLEPATCHVAELLILVGDSQGALDALEPAFARLARPAYFATTLPSAAAYAVLAARAIGDESAAQRWITQCRWMRLPEPGRLSPLDAIDRTARYHMAEESAGAGDLDAATAILGDLVREGPSELLRGDAFPIPNPGLRTLYALRLVEVLYARGRAEDGARAEAVFADLLAFYRRAGATWYIERLTERARLWGVRVYGPPTKGETRGELTRREREVTLLVARGLTNREIASQLTISVRTAESHVEQIRLKLGFRTRAQIASWATERYGARSN